jgi:hypothetical protein
VELNDTEKELLEFVWNCMALKKIIEVLVELHDTEKELLEFLWNCITLKKNYWNACGTAWH